MRSQSRAADRGRGFGGQAEQLLHFGLGRGQTDGRRVADHATGFAEFFQLLAPARVVMEVGTHSPWARDVVAR
jgi:hypothetical protein